MPNVRVYPLCSECRAPYVLRHALIMLPSGKSGWVWQRDCKHKHAAPLASNAPRMRCGAKAEGRAP